MVLPTSASDAGAASPAWLAKLLAQLERARRGVLFALIDATPTQLGPVVRALSRVSPWEPHESDGALEVCLHAVELLDVKPGSRVLLRVRAEDLEWLNLHRPIFSDRELRTILWVDQAALDGLVRQAVDLFDWVSRVVTVPSAQLPEFARDGVRAALSVEAAFSWAGTGLDELLAEHECNVIDLDAGRASWELVAALRGSGLPVVSGLRHEQDAWRVRMLLAWVGRGRSWVARDPDETLAGMWPLHALQQDWDVATAKLRASGRPRPALLAAWVELEPERVEWLAAHPEADVDEYDFDAVVRETAPAWMLRQHAGDDAVEVARALLVSNTDGPPEDLAGQIIWARGQGAWDDAQQGEPAPRLVRALRSLGTGVPTPQLVLAAKEAGFDEIGVALELIRWNAHADSRADELVAWLRDRGHSTLALNVASEWHERADDPGSFASASCALAKLHLTLGRPVLAQTEFEHAVEVLRAAIAQDPNRPSLERTLADCLVELGDLHGARGDAEQALRCFEEAQTLGRALLARAPEDLDLAAALAAGLDQLGKYHLNRGDDEQARVYLDEALTLARELTRRAPERDDFRWNLTVSLEALGDLELRLRDPAEARSKFEECLAIRTSELARNPDNLRLRRGLAVSHERLGEFHEMFRDLERAQEHLRASLELTESVAVHEPLRPDYQLGLVAALRRLATVLRVLGSIEDSRRHLERALALGQALVEAYPQMSEAQRELAVVFDRLANLHELAGDLGQALNLRTRARAIDRHLVDQEPDDVNLRRDYAVGLLGLGLLQDQVGDSEHSAESLSSALAEYRLLCEKMPGRVDLQHELMCVLAQLGTLDDDLELLLEAYLIAHDLRSRDLLQPSFEELANALHVDVLGLDTPKK